MNLIRQLSDGWLVVSEGDGRASLSRPSNGTNALNMGYGYFPRLKINASIGNAGTKAVHSKERRRCERKRKG